MYFLMQKGELPISLMGLELALHMYHKNKKPHYKA